MWFLGPCMHGQLKALFLHAPCMGASLVLSLFSICTWKGGWAQD